MSKGKNVLFDIDWQGSEQIRKKKSKNKLISIFVLPPSIDTLRDRLSNRDMKDKLIVEERMRQFKTDVLHWRDYDYVVINNNLEKCYEEIMSIIHSVKEGKSYPFNQNIIKEKISELIG